MTGPEGTGGALPWARMGRRVRAKPAARVRLERDRRPHDTRLVVPAIACWCVALVAVGWTGRHRVALLLALAAVGGLTLWRGVRRGRGVHRTRWPRPTVSIATASALAVVVLISVLAQDAVRHGPGTIAALHADRGVAFQARVDGLPRGVSAGRAGQGRVVVEATLLAVESGRVGSPRTTAARAPVVLLASSSWPVPAPGTLIRGTGTALPTSPGERAVALVVVDGDPAVVGEPPVWQRGTAALRAGLRAAVDGLAPHAVGLLPGIAVGDDSQVSDTLATAMRTTALGHLLAVSGAHVALLIGGVLACAGGLPHPVRIGLGALVLVGLVLLVGAEPSVVRAAAMGVVALVAVALGRRGAAVPALSAAVLVLVVTDPWIAREVGFCLSVSATAGIVLLAPGWTDAIAGRLGRAAPLAPAIAVPLAAQVACMPVLLVVDPGIATYGVIANALVAPVVPAATVLALAATLVGPVSSTLAHGLVWAAQPTTWWIDQVAMRASRAPFAMLPWPGPPGGPVLAFVIAGTVLVLRWSWPGVGGTVRTTRAWHVLRRVGAALVVATPFAVAALAVLPATRAGVVAVAGDAAGSGVPGDWRVLACDVGQGSALLVASSLSGGGERAVLVDTGPDDGSAARCLGGAGVAALDVLVLTHADLDHAGGLVDVLAVVDVELMLVPVSPDPRLPRVVAAAELRGVEVRWLTSADPPISAGSLVLTPLWPTPRAVELAGGTVTPHGGSDAPGATERLAPTVDRGAPSATSSAHSDSDSDSDSGWSGESAAANDLSLTLWITTPDLTVLAHGDLGSAAQARLGRTLPTDLLPPDVLVVPHHGSPDQDEDLLRRTAGRVSVVSVGADNGYGHPSPQRLEQLVTSGSLVVRTDRCGTTAIRAGPEGTVVVSSCSGG